MTCSTYSIYGSWFVDLHRI